MLERNHKQSMKPSILNLFPHLIICLNSNDTILYHNTPLCHVIMYSFTDMNLSFGNESMPSDQSDLRIQQNWGIRTPQAFQTTIKVIQYGINTMHGPYAHLQCKGSEAFIDDTFARCLSVLDNWLCVVSCIGRLPLILWISIKRMQQMVEHRLWCLLGVFLVCRTSTVLFFLHRNKPSLVIWRVPFWAKLHGDICWLKWN